MSKYSTSWLDVENAFGGRFTVNGDANNMRQQFAGLASALVPHLPPPSEAVSTRDGEVDGIKYRIYLPKKVGINERLPMAGYIHGGGFVLGDLDTEDAICRAVSEHTRSAVISVDYRLAPEHQCPIQFEDTIRVFEWAIEHANSYHMDPTKFYTIGTSAGAALTLSVANYFIAKSKTKSSSKTQIAVKGVAAVAPMTLHPDNVPSEYRSMYNSYQEFKTDSPCIDDCSMRYFFKAANIKSADERYLPGLSTENHPYFPPTYLAVCECDPLRDDGIVMAQMLEKAGVNVQVDFYRGMPHLFWMFPMLTENKEFVENLVKGVNWLIEQM